MANGISIMLPLVYSKQDGPFQLNKTIPETVKQNFKNLVMTVQGERLMDPDFGIGIQSFLFENYSPSAMQILKSKAIDQVLKYMPFLEIQDFIVTESKSNINQFYIYIKYSITSMNVLDELNFTVSR
jgi:phage baseplate assembly protein W